MKQEAPISISWGGSLPYYYEDASIFIHCEDIGEDPEYFKNWKFVVGNNVYFYSLPEAMKFKVENHHILLIHVHQCSYQNRKEDLVKFAKKNDCDIVCFGHIHVANIDEIEGITFMNPGSILNLRNGRPCSYCVLTIEKEKNQADIVFEPD